MKMEILQYYEKLISHAFLMKTYLYETSGYFTLTLDTILGAGQQVLPEKRS
jgi:hypothetical protein